MSVPECVLRHIGGRFLGRSAVVTLLRAQKAWQSAIRHGGVRLRGFVCAPGGRERPGQRGADLGHVGMETRCGWRKPEGGLSGTAYTKAATPRCRHRGREHGVPRAGSRASATRWAGSGCVGEAADNGRQGAPAKRLATKRRGGGERSAARVSETGGDSLESPGCAVPRQDRAGTAAAVARVVRYEYVSCPGVCEANACSAGNPLRPLACLCTQRCSTQTETEKEVHVERASGQAVDDRPRTGTPSSIPAAPPQCDLEPRRRAGCAEPARESNSTRVPARREGSSRTLCAQLVVTSAGEEARSGRRKRGVGARVTSRQRTSSPSRIRGSPARPPPRRHNPPPGHFCGYLRHPAGPSSRPAPPSPSSERASESSPVQGSSVPLCPCW
ncbi:hypothetical protein C8Q79DRAFT_107127 [Trametes meyenii]|nr:hypothetical protein C8Q79DRAFT_107127 [Trametes meyenii]